MCCSEESEKRYRRILSELKNTLLSIHEATQTPFDQKNHPHQPGCAESGAETVTVT